MDQNYLGSCYKKLATLALLSLCVLAAVDAQAGSGAEYVSSKTVKPAALQLLHTDYRTELTEVSQLITKIGFEHITADNYKKVRMDEAAKVQPPLASPAVYKKTISGSAGQPDVGIYVVNAKAADTKPAILYMHGGGFVLGSPALYLPSIQQLAQRHNCTIVMVEYRLAPETQFPGALEDNYAALKYIYQNASELGIDKTKIVIMGHSAGGGHAAMLAIAARDRAEVPIKHQVLIFPMLDDRTGSSRKVPEQIGKLLWTAVSNEFGWSALLGQKAGIPQVPYGSVPARVEDLSNLPPTDIIVGAIDLFVEEDIEYAKRLIQHGVPTELHVLPGMFHASEAIYPDADISKRFSALENSAVERALRN
ncbi:alpha/beta hydrolase [Rheinheimera soli]|uniref:alpha/beta hydrolase n=1 Tax=Rheinheimera soli TaxID=443616 RepID=UPI001E62224B|nr:alpha/beta hydrolase [Rheinheimera soli]